MKVKVSLDRTAYKEKPNKDQMKSLSNRVAGRQVEMEIQDAATLIGNHGHTFSPAIFTRSRRTAENFIEMQLFALDFDEGISVEVIQERAEKYCLPIAFAYHTFSSSEECNKFRIVFLNDVPVTDRCAAEIMLGLLLKIFPEADRNCKDVSRMFLGGKGLIGSVRECTINIVVLTEQYQRFCFINSPKNYVRDIQGFAKKYNIACRQNCLQIMSVHEDGKIEDFLGSDPYIYGSISEFPSKIPQYIIYRGYQPDVHRNDTQMAEYHVNLGKMEEKCRLYQDFLRKPHIHHNERFLLMTNMIHLNGGTKRFLSTSEKKGYDRDDWRFYVKYAKDKGYKPQACVGNCPYCETCCHKQNMVLTVKEKDNVIRVREERYYELNQVELHVYEQLRETVRKGIYGIQIIPAQTAVGKTEAYCRLIADDTERKYIIAVPTNLLKMEVAKRLTEKGICAKVTQSVDDLRIPLELRNKIQYYYQLGLGRNVIGLLRQYIKDYGNYEDGDTMRAVAQCREYVHFEQQMKKYRVIVTTHARLITFSGKNLKGCTVIIDEDILSTFFKNIRTVSLDAVQRACGSEQCTKTLKSRLDQILDAEDEEYYMFADSGTFDYISEDELEKLRIGEDVNNIALADSFQRSGESVHYFCAQMLPKGKYVVLSATADPKLYSSYFKGWNVASSLYYRAKYLGQLKQLTAYSVSRQCLLERKKDFIRFLEPLKKDYQMITFMKFEKEFQTSGLHFGNAEGVDFLNGKNLLVLGTPHLSEFVYKLIGCYLGMEVNQDVLSVRRVRYKDYEFNLMSYKGEDLRLLQMYFISKELEQCIGRARLLRNDCKVLVLSNFPCEQAELDEQDYLDFDTEREPGCL